MKRNRRVAVMVVATSVLAAGAFALSRYRAYGQTEVVLQQRVQELARADRAWREHPTALSGASAGPGVELKTLVQEGSLRHGVSVVQLSESTRDCGSGHREQSVVARMTDVPQASLVSFLWEVEQRGEGTRVKELHLRPAKQGLGRLESEVVFVRRYVGPQS